MINDFQIHDFRCLNLKLQVIPTKNTSFRWFLTQTFRFYWCFSLLQQNYTRRSCILYNYTSSNLIHIDVIFELLEFAIVCYCFGDFFLSQRIKNSHFDHPLMCNRFALKFIPHTHVIVMMMLIESRLKISLFDCLYAVSRSIILRRQFAYMLNADGKTKMWLD